MGISSLYGLALVRFGLVLGVCVLLELLHDVTTGGFWWLLCWFGFSGLIRLVLVVAGLGLMWSVWLVCAVWVGFGCPFVRFGWVEWFSGSLLWVFDCDGYLGFLLCCGVGIILFRMGFL